MGKESRSSAVTVSDAENLMIFQFEGTRSSSAAPELLLDYDFFLPDS